VDAKGGRGHDGAGAGTGSAAGLGSSNRTVGTSSPSACMIGRLLSAVWVGRSWKPPPLIARKMASLSGFPPNFVKAGFNGVPDMLVGGGGGGG
jgi:hypothetical protein